MGLIGKPLSLARRLGWPRLAMGAVLALGLGLRVAVLATPMGMLDSDEAVVGLMGRHILQGEFPVFFWGQFYGGSQEAMLAASGFALLGSSTLVLKLVPLLLDAVATALVWRLGLRTVGPRRAMAAAALFWIWPATFVWWSTKERGFYWICMVAGLAMLLFAMRLAERPDRRREWIWLGLSAGVGWWASPQVGFFLLPACLFLVIRAPRALRWAPLGVAAALVGAAPWLVFNLTHSWASFDVPPYLRRGSYLEHLGIFFSRGLPMALGLRVPYTEAWVMPVVAEAIYAAVVVALLVAVGRRRRGLGLVLLVVAAFPFLHALSPGSQSVGEGRYYLYLAPALALVLVSVVTSRPVAAGLVGAWLSVTSFGLVALVTASVQRAPDVPIPASMTSLISTLHDHQARYVLADYWIAYRLSFESGEKVIATSTTTMRYQPYDSVVRASARPAWVFVEGSRTEIHFRRALIRLKVRYERVRRGGFVLYFPARRILPREL